MRAVGITNIGLVRHKNEDSFVIKQEQGLFAVCDGMGGHKGGDVASKMAARTIEELVNFDSVDEAVESISFAIKKANSTILEEARQNPDLSDMGTTITAAAVVDNTIVVGHVGDSSLFIIRNRTITKITRDHTLAEKMVADGLFKPEEAKKHSYNHILTRAVGTEDSILVDVFVIELYRGNTILICTDGLTDLLDEQDILRIVAEHDDLHRTAQDLINMALSRGGHDNITTILVRV